MKKSKRITIDPNVCAGKPCICGLRFPVSRILVLLAAGETKETILKAYPYLEPEDIDEALRYMASLPSKPIICILSASIIPTYFFIDIIYGYMK
jgi:uncharacterized protein (DUF433 family)